MLQAFCPTHSAHSHPHHLFLEIVLLTKTEQQKREIAPHSRSDTFTDPQRPYALAQTPDLPHVCQGPSVLPPEFHPYHGVLSYTCNPSILKAEAGGPGVQVQG